MSVMKKFWIERVNKEFDKRKFSERKGMSDWNLLYTILLKYNLSKVIRLRGISAFEGALKLIEKKEHYEKLEEKEKEFITGLISK